MDEDTGVSKELECPICKEYMQSPIYQCQNGHSFCSNCKPKISSCPVCRAAVQNTRNFLTEKLLPMIHLSCKFRSNNCSFVDNLEKMRSHELVCKFKPYECPLDGYLTCNWKGELTNLLDHLKQNHFTNIFHENVNFFTMDFKPPEVTNMCYIKEAFKNLFKVFLQYQNEKLLITVQFIGPAEKAENFLYKFDTSSESGSQLTIQEPCTSLTDYENIFSSQKTFITLPRALLVGGNKLQLLYKLFILER